MKVPALPAPRRLGSARESAASAWSSLEADRQALRAKASIATPLGWAVAGCGVAAWIVGARLGWQELEIVAGACLAVLVLSALFTIGRAELAIDVRLDPARVVVGEPAAGQVTVTNLSRHRLLPLRMELPVGEALARFDLPALAGNASSEELFVIPTNRRAVIPVGPATSVRGDPLGALRREIAFTDRVELFVHPRTALLDTLGSGFLRDLEGNTTDAISPSDLAFHSLRAYVPGDDRRHVHWRTTARVPSGDLMVRQFLDTRRSHLVVVLDGAETSYAGEQEFELAVSAGASLALRAIRDEQAASVVPGLPAVASGGGTHLLDAFSRAERSLEAAPLTDLAGRAVESCRDASIAVLVSGANVQLAELRRAAGRFDQDTRVIAIVTDLEATSSVKTGAGLTILTLPSLADLAPLVQGAIAA